MGDNPGIDFFGGWGGAFPRRADKYGAQTGGMARPWCVGPEFDKDALKGGGEN